MSGAARLLFVGDISLGGDYVRRYGHGSPRWTEPFVEIQPLFRAADLRVGNLESPLHASATPRRKKNLLTAPPEAAEALSFLGLDVLNLGNNHITDQGSEGIARTREVLESRGISCFGAGENVETAGRPVFAEAKDLSFAFLGYAVPGQDVGAEAATEAREGCVPPTLERVERDIANARRRAGHVVVSLHWGYQYDRYPDPDQIATARRIIDLGALIVYGHHPHVTQGIERYRNGLILYSLGNFFFPDFVRSDGRKFRFPSESHATATVLCDVEASGVRSFATVPVAVARDDRMRILHGRAAARVARPMLAPSGAFDSPAYVSSWRAHHRRTERRRRRQEESFRVRGEISDLLRLARARGVAGSLRGLNGRHLGEILHLIRRVARLFQP